MASWLTNFNEAKKKPIRTLFVTTAVGFAALALIDYFLAGTRSYASAGAVGGICAVMIALGISRAIWPGVFDRSITSRPRTQFARHVWRWAYPTICLVISLVLIGVGIAGENAGVAITGIPFLVIGAVIAVAKKRVIGR
jgi:hypothetical protein